MSGLTRISFVLFVYAAFNPILAAEPLKDADAVLEQARQQNEQQEILIRKLIAIAANEEESPSKRQSALETLGTMNSRQAIAGLLDHLLVEAAVICEFHSLAKYPAASSLNRIGSAGFPEIWVALNRERTDRYLFVLAHVIFRIDGRKVAEARIKEMLESTETTAQQKANIEKLRGVFQDIDFKNAMTWP